MDLLVNPEVPNPTPVPPPIPVVDGTAPPTRKFPYQIILVVLFLILSVSGGVWLGRKYENKKAAEKPAVVSDVTPSPVVVRLKSEVAYLTGTAWKLVGEQKVALKEGDILEAADVVETDAETKLVINFDDGSVVRLDESTKLSLSSVTPALISLLNQQGKVYARVQKDPEHKFTVQAKNVVVEATGTIFAVENLDQVKVKVFESSVNVKVEGELLSAINEQEEWDDQDKKAQEMDEQENKQDKFLAWNKTEDEKLKPTPTPTAAPSPKPTAKASAKISLSANATAEGVDLSWNLNGIEAPNGVKVIKGPEANPVFPGNDGIYLGDTKIKSYRWAAKDGKTWHFRVCSYVDGKCANYSNDVSVQTVLKEGNSTTSSVNSINLSVQKQDNKAKLTWTVDGNSALGFKIAWSHDENPTYPPKKKEDLWNYQSNPGTREFTTDGLSGTYHFRVCEYLGGSCGKYSNDVSLSF